MAVSHAWLMAAPGAENKLPQASSTVVLVNAFSKPPITMAVKMARKITVTELPSRIDSLRIWPNDLRLASGFSRRFVAVGRPRRTRGFRGTRRRLLAHELSPAPACSASGACAAAPGASDPAISRPSSSTGTEGGRKPVIRPSYMTAIRSASA